MSSDYFYLLAMQLTGASIPAGAMIAASHAATARPDDTFRHRHAAMPACGRRKAGQWHLAAMRKNRI